MKIDRHKMSVNLRMNHPEFVALQKLVKLGKGRFRKEGLRHLTGNDLLVMENAGLTVIETLDEEDRQP